MEKRIIGSKETVKLDAQGNLVTYVVYTYMLDDMGPFTVEMPKAQETSEAVNNAINRKMETLKGVTGAE